MKLRRLLPIALLFLFTCTALAAQAQKSRHRVVFALTSGDPLDWHLTSGNIGIF